MTMKLIRTLQVSPANGGATGVTFTSIPQDGTDLVVHISGRSTDTTTSPIYLEWNGTTTGYSYLTLQGSGSAVTSTTSSTAYIGNLVPSNYTTATFCNNTTFIPNYSRTGDGSKNWITDSVQENNATAAAAIMISGKGNAAAITSLRIYPGGTSQFADDTTISLYTVTKGSGGASVA